jgi:hypothetical protein
MQIRLGGVVPKLTENWRELLYAWQHQARRFQMLRTHMTGFDLHEQEQHRSKGALDESIFSAVIKVLTTLAIVLAAMGIAIVANVLHVY